MKKLILLCMLISLCIFVTADDDLNYLLDIYHENAGEASISDSGVNLKTIDELIVYDFYCVEVNLINGYEPPLYDEGNLYLREGSTYSIKKTRSCDFETPIRMQGSPNLLVEYENVLISNRDSQIFTTPLEGKFKIADLELSVGQVYVEDKNELVTYAFEPESNNLGEIKEESNLVTAEVVAEKEEFLERIGQTTTQPTVTEKVEETEDDQTNEETEESESGFREFVENNFGFVLDKIPIGDATLRFYIFVIVIAYLIYLVVRR